MTEPEPAAAAAATVTFPVGTFRPDPAPASGLRMMLAASSIELRIQLRNGEQLLLALIIPIAVLIGLTLTSVVDLDGRRVDVVTPGVFTLAVLSSAFTAQAISTAFDRKYGVLQRLAVAGVSRTVLLTGKCCSVLVVVGGQLVVLGIVAALLGWHPAGTWPLAVPVLLLGVAALVGMGLLVGGTLRAEAVLAVANLAWLVLIGLGGVIVPLSSAPPWLHAIGSWTPVGALSEGLQHTLRLDVGPGLRVWLVLLAWVAVAGVAALKAFRWQ